MEFALTLHSNQHRVLRGTRASECAPCGLRRHNRPTFSCWHTTIRYFNGHNASATSADYGVDGWVESFDYYSSKFCLGASPPGEGQGQDSIIVGEVYTNTYGGVDSFYDSA